MARSSRTLSICTCFLPALSTSTYSVHGSQLTQHPWLEHDHWGAVVNIHKWQWEGVGEGKLEGGATHSAAEWDANGPWRLEMRPPRD